MQVAFASAIITGDFRDVENEFHVGEVVTALSVSLMVVGFGLGPLCWSPLDVVDRRCDRIYHKLIRLAALPHQVIIAHMF